jgi:hypothetical protein
VDFQILTQLVVVEYESGEKVAVHVDEIEIIPASKTIKEEQDNTPKNNEQNNLEAKEQ